MSSLPLAKAQQLERREDVIGKVVVRLRESREANKRYFDKTARLHMEEPQLGNLVLMHETRIEQTHNAKLEASWRGLYRIAERAEKLGTYKLEELHGTPLTEWTNGSRLKKFFVRESQDSTSPPDDPRETAEFQEQDKEQRDEDQKGDWEVEEVMGRKYQNGQCMYLVRWKDWEKRTWALVTDMEGARDMIDAWNASHPVPANHPSRR